MLERIVTVSRAVPEFGSEFGLEALYGLIREAHVQNARAGLTGGLVLLDGWIAQVLEGPPAPVAFAYGRMRQDPRHGALELRAREPALCRLFPGQAMALRTRACLDPALLEAFAYRPGFPVGSFPSDVLVEFLVQACHREPGVRRAAR
jgi:Sensors of blue-light using FAD